MLGNYSANNFSNSTQMSNSRFSQQSEEEKKTYGYDNKRTNVNNGGVATSSTTYLGQSRIKDNEPRIKVSNNGIKQRSDFGNFYNNTRNIEQYDDDKQRPSINELIYQYRLESRQVWKEFRQLFEFL